MIKLIGGIMSIKGKTIMYISIAILLIMSATTAYFTLVLLIDPIPAPSAIYEEYEPKKVSLCPGDYFELTGSLKIVRFPIVLHTYETWVDGSTGSTIVRDTFPESTIRTKAEILIFHQVILVPELFPGTYEYRRATEQSYTGATVLIVKVEVPAECGK